MFQTIIINIVIKQTCDKLIVRNCLLHVILQNFVIVMKIRIYLLSLLLSLSRSFLFMLQSFVKVSNFIMSSLNTVGVVTGYEDCRVNWIEVKNSRPK